MKKNKNWLALILGLVLLLGLGQAAQALLPPPLQTLVLRIPPPPLPLLGIRSGIRTATTCAWNFASPMPRR